MWRDGVGQRQLGGDRLASQTCSADVPKEIAGAKLQPLGGFDHAHDHGAELIAPMRLTRKADFTPFSSNRLLYPVRIVTRSEIHKKGKEIVYTVEANGFLRYMVRSIVGTLIEVGRGRLNPGQIEELFKLNKRSPLCPTAPAKGLTLLKVKY